MTEDVLEQLVRGIIEQNKRRRAEWSDALGEVTSSIANGEEIPADRLEEILNGLNDDGTEGDAAGEDG